MRTEQKVEELGVFSPLSTLERGDGLLSATHKKKKIPQYFTNSVLSLSLSHALSSPRDQPPAGASE